MLEQVKERKIIEVRFAPLLSIFDKRGLIVKKLADEFDGRLNHWKVDSSSILYSESQKFDSFRVQVDHLRALIIQEDPDNDHSFESDSIKFFELLYNIFKSEFYEIKRIGVRYISVFASDLIDNFDDARVFIQDSFFKKSLPFSFDLTDVKATVNHDQGSLSIGPVRQGEQWLTNLFTHFDEEFPEVGIGIDVDSFISSTSWGKESDVKRTLKAVNATTQSVKKEVIGNLSGLLDDQKK